jgi:putative DNA primase/helicase
MSSRHERDELIQALIDRVNDLARTLLGSPNKALSTKAELRFGNSGSLSVAVSGARAGLWYSFEDGIGGGPLELIMRERGLSPAEGFRWARAWLGGSFSLGDSHSLKASRRSAPSSANGNRAKAPEPDPREDPTVHARRIWAESVPIAATCAERYLRECRGITGELPDNLRMATVWHKEAKQSFPSLIVGAFGPDGELHRLQAVFLNPATGEKAGVKPAKKTFGPGSTPAVFRGPPSAAFDVLLCEGPEDGLALRSALEAGDVGAVLGAGCLHKPQVAEGTRVCIVSDGDAAGAKAAQKAAVEHTLRGCEVWIATPPAGTKDANALLLKQGPDAVRAMIAAAEPYCAPAPPDALPPRLDAAEAQKLVNEAVEQAFAEGLAWKPPEPRNDIDGLNLNDTSEKPLPPVWGIKATLGLGKSQAVLKRLADPALAGLSINYFAPEHRLNDELLTRYAALAAPGSPEARIVRGYQQELPDGTPMCRKADLAAAVGALGLPVGQHLCERKARNGAEPERCEHFDTCPMQRQAADKRPGVRFMSHAHLFVKHTHKADFHVIDEAYWQAGIRGCDRSRPYFVAFHWLEALRSVPAKGKGLKAGVEMNDVGAEAELRDISLRCVRALKAGGLRTDFEAAGVSASDARHASGLEYRRTEKLSVTPGMDWKAQADAIKNHAANTALKLGRFFRLLAEALEAGADPALTCFEIALNVENPPHKPEDRVIMRWRAPMTIADKPVLLLDATLDGEIARVFFPQMAEPVVIEAALTGYHAIQAPDVAWPKNRLCHKDTLKPEEANRRSNRRDELRWLHEVEAAKGESVLITYRAAEEAIAERAAELPNSNPKALFGHFNRLRGHDEWRDVSSLIIVGRPQPNAQAVEDLTRALWHATKEPIKRLFPDARYPRETRFIMMADGRHVPVQVDTHPDWRCARVLDQIRAEMTQAIGRARLVHRDPAKPCRVIVLGEYPVGLPIHELATWESLKPGPLEVMKARGLVLKNRDHAAMVLSDIFPTGNALRQWLKANPEQAQAWNEFVSSPYRKIPTGESHKLVAIRYKVEGSRQAAEGWIDPSRHPDPRAALENVLGPLALFGVPDVGAVERAADEAPAAAPPPVPLEPMRPEPMPVGAVADTGEISDLVAPEPSQPPALDAVARAEPEASPPPEDHDRWLGWPGPDPAEMRRQAALPRLVVANMPEPPPEELSDAELIRLLPPKRPTDNTVGWEIKAHDVLRAWGVEWFRAQKLVREQSAAHDWRAHCPVRLAHARDSP